MTKIQYEEIYSQIFNKLQTYGYGEFIIVDIEHRPKTEFCKEFLDVILLQNVDTEIKVIFTKSSFSVDFDYELKDVEELFLVTPF